MLETRDVQNWRQGSCHCMVAVVKTAKGSQESVATRWAVR